MAIDTHTHLHDRAFDEDRDAVAARMRAAGFEDAVTVGCDLADSQRALACARTYGIHASVGIHPHEAKDAPASIEAAFAPFLDDPRIVAVGEIGLDYHYDHSPRDVQRVVFRRQLRLARDAGKPVIFHQREAFDDFLAIVREEWDPAMRGVVHCFSGDAAQARLLIGEFGLMLGIGGVVTFKNADALRDAVREAGIGAIVIETDAPYLAPVPHRGKRNEPAYAAIAAETIARLLDLAPSGVLERTAANARALFELSA